MRGEPVDLTRESRELAELRQWEEATFSRVPDVAGAAGERPSPPDWLQGVVMPELPIRWDARVVEYLRFYKDDPRGRAIMKGWLENQGRYHGLIQATLDRHKLPRDLVCVEPVATYLGEPLVASDVVALVRGAEELEVALFARDRERSRTRHRALRVRKVRSVRCGLWSGA